MSRFGDDYEQLYPNQADLWDANLRRALSGKRGQQALRDLEQALLALPEKRLISGHLAHGTEVCAIGALVAYRRRTRGEELEAILADLEGRAPVLCYCGHPEPEHAGGICAGCIERAHWWNDARTLRIERGTRFDERFERIQPPRLCAAFQDAGETEDYGDITARAGTDVGLTYTLAWHFAYMNDESLGEVTPEERYERILAYARDAQIHEATA